MRRTGRGRLAVGLLVTAGALSACTGGLSSDDRSARASSPGPTTRYEYTAVVGGGRPAGPSASRSAGRVTSPGTTTSPRVRPGQVPRVALDFAWADGDDGPFANAACLTIVRGLSPRQALRVLVPSGRITDAATARRTADGRNGGGSDDGGSYYQWVLAGRRGGWTFVLEDNGYLATEDSATTALSRRGTAIVLFSNVEAEQDFRYAKRGRTLRAFDPLLYSSEIGRRLPAERGLPFGEERAGIYHSMALAMTLAQRLTGFRITRADLQLSSYTLGAVARY